MVDFLVVHVDELHLVAVAVDDRDVLVVEIDHLVGIFHDWRCVGAEEELPVANSHHKRATLTRRNDLVGIVLVDDGESVCSDDHPERHPDGCEQVHILLGADIVDELHEHLGVGVAAELHSLFHELVLEHRIVLNDAVVDDGKLPRRADMRMGIGAVGLSMCGPTGVCNSNGSRHVLSIGIFLQVGHLSFGLIDLQSGRFGDERHTGTVVATVFQSFQSFNQHRISLAFSYISNDSTHNFCMFLISKSIDNPFASRSISDTCELVCKIDFAKLQVFENKSVFESVKNAVQNG